MLDKVYKINWLLVFILSIISFIGFIALYSAAGSNMSPWASKQLVRFFVSLALLFIVAIIDIRFWYKYAYYIFALSILLLVGVEFVGSGTGAKRWIRFFGFSIQPSEVVKVCLIIVLARFYHDVRYGHINWIRNFFIPIILIFIPFFLVLKQPDLGTSIMILILGVSIMFVAGIKIWKFVLSFFIFLFSLPFIWNLLLKSYQKDRILSFLSPEKDPLGSGYHLLQSKIALGSGGIYGKGFLKGSQSYLNFLPEKQTDFIFTMIGEEFGFIGTIFILLLYVLLILICFYIAFQAMTNFGRIIAIGVGINLFLYVFLNTSMVIGILPIVGVPLPLLSYGGTVMLSVMISFGLLQNVAVYQKYKKL